MRHPVFALLALLVTAAAAWPQAGGYIVYENGSPDMGSSYAGSGARAQDAATAFENPAGLTNLKDHQLLLGGFAMITDFELDLGGGTVSVPAGSTDGGGDQGQLLPGIGTYGAFVITDELRLGFALNVLAGNGVDYDQTWVGRSFVTENQLLVANIQPTIAYRVNDWFSIGAGLNIAFMSLEQEFLANDGPGAPTIQIDDADDWQIGGTFGLMFEPTEKTRIGVKYRTEFEFELSGDIDVPFPVDVNFDSDMPFPQGANLSIYHQLTDTFALLGDVGWTDWSAFDRIPTSVGPLSGTQDRNWHDTYRIGIGMQWDFAESWRLRSGFSYDSSPVDEDDMLPDIPTGDQYRFSVGLQHDFGEGKILGASYTLMYSDIEFDNVALPNGAILDGEYDPSLIHYFGVTFTLLF